MDAQKAQDAVKSVKRRLLEAGMLIKIPCLWCIVANETVVDPAHMEEANEHTKLFHRFVKWHGFHCENEEHAENFHKLCCLDQNMHFSCCDPLFMSATTVGQVLLGSVIED